MGVRRETKRGKKKKEISLSLRPKKKETGKKEARVTDRIKNGEEGGNARSVLKVCILTQGL